MSSFLLRLLEDVFDVHKHYTLASVEDPAGRILREARVDHQRGALRHFLAPWDSGSPVAVEAVGNWYWIVDEVEGAHMVPQLVNPGKAKLMMGMINKRKSVFYWKTRTADSRQLAEILPLSQGELSGGMGERGETRSPT